MEAPIHTMGSLFAQLGLSSEAADIDRFIAVHRPLDENLALCHAPFWSQAQRTFLAEEIIEDADWVGVIDELNARLSC